jgi:hypothetical protein
MAFLLVLNCHRVLGNIPLMHSARIQMDNWNVHRRGKLLDLMRGNTSRYVSRQIRPTQKGAGVTTGLNH